MVNQEILGGLRSAIERGESLKKAMMTLYSSGYKKEEIEEGAKILLEYNKESHPNLPIQEIPKTQPIQPLVPRPAQPMQQPPAFQRQAPQPVMFQRPVLQPQQIQKPIQPARTYPSQPENFVPVQRISNYEGGITPREKAIIFILVSLLIFLVASLGLIFLFKQDIINFFSSIFGQ